jgi:septal ring factor EnvC (AmiA/AmiB activator)
MIPRLMVWVCIALALRAAVPLGWCAESGGQPFDQQVTQPVQRAVTIRQATQKQEEQWRDDQQKLSALYEKLQTEQEHLKTTRDELKESITDTHRRIADKEKQLAAIEQIRTRIEPFLHESLKALRQQIGEDLPFLPEERRQRAERLAELLEDPEVAISEKYRKVLEAWMVEAEYGNTIEVYQQTIAVENREMLVNVFRLGRISLFYQTLDHNGCGFFDVAAGTWRPLPDDYNRTLSTAIDIGTKRKPAELMSLPLGRISVK